MKKILLFTIFGLISSAETPDREHEGAKKKIGDILKKSPFKATSQKTFSSPNTSKTMSRFSELGKKLKYTPSKTKERILAISLAADILPADEVRSLASQFSLSSPPPALSADLFATFSSKISKNVQSPKFSKYMQDRLKTDARLTPRLKGNIEDFDNLSPNKMQRLVNLHHLLGEKQGGGHLFQTPTEYSNNFAYPTIKQTGRGPIMNPETGVSVGFYQIPDSSKIKFSTVFPLGLKTENIFNIMQNTEKIISSDSGDKSLEIATLDNGTKIPMIVNHNKSGMLDQPFPVWTYKELGERVPGFDLTRQQILTHAKSDFENIIFKQDSPIIFENDDFIVYDLARKLFFSAAPSERAGNIQKGALVKIDKSELR